MVYKAVLQLEPLSCPSCIKKIESALNRQTGVEFAKVLFNVGKIKIEFDEARIQLGEIVKRVEELGYQVIHQKAS